MKTKATKLPEILRTMRATIAKATPGTNWGNTTKHELPHGLLLMMGKSSNGSIWLSSKRSATGDEMKEGSPTRIRFLAELAVVEANAKDAGLVLTDRRERSAGEGALDPKVGATWYVKDAEPVASPPVQTDLATWSKAHGFEGATDKDLADLRGAVRTLAEFFKDGEWKTSVEIRARVPSQYEVLRRVRDLRADVKPLGFDVETKRLGGRLFAYRLVRLSAEGGKE